MTLVEYYKAHVYEQGYEDNARGRASATKGGDIYYEDEMDYYIIADYLSSYAMADDVEGVARELGDKDMKLIQALGFDLEDFIDRDYNPIDI